MKFFKAALILSSVLMSNVGYALETPNVNTRIDLSRAHLITPTPKQVPEPNNPNFILLGGGNILPSGTLNLQDSSVKWGVKNPPITFPDPVSIGGSISISSPLIVTTTGSSISVPQITLAATAIPEADTYLMLLTGLGLIGATVARRSAR